MNVDPAALGAILGVWAHPDDEAYLAGGIMAAAVEAGNRVVCVTATKGEAGFPEDDPRTPEERAAVRAAELKESLSILGVREHHWLGHGDGACHLVDFEAAVSPIVALLEVVRPRTVLTFGPDGMTGHPDHISVGRWTTDAFRRTVTWPSKLFHATKTKHWNETFFSIIDPQLVMMVEGMQPPESDDDDIALHVMLGDKEVDRKESSLAAQASQIGPLRDHVGEETYRELLREESFLLVQSVGD